MLLALLVKLDNALTAIIVAREASFQVMLTKPYFYPDWCIYVYVHIYLYMCGTYILLQISICSSKMADDPAALSWSQLLTTVDGAFLVAFALSFERGGITARGLHISDCVLAAQCPAFD